MTSGGQVADTDERYEEKVLHGICEGRISATIHTLRWFLGHVQKFPVHGYSGRKSPSLV